MMIRDSFAKKKTLDDDPVHHRFTDDGTWFLLDGHGYSFCPCSDRRVRFIPLRDDLWLGGTPLSAMPRFVEITCRARLSTLTGRENPILPLLWLPYRNGNEQCSNQG